MPSRKFHSLPDQVAGSIRAEIGKGGWSGMVPGRDKLTREFGVSGKTVEAALQLLQREGLLKSQGAGKRRLIVAQNNAPAPSLRLAIMTLDPLAECESYLTELQNHLVGAGHSAFFTSKSLTELGALNIRKFSRFVKETKADAWIVEAGSLTVLEWFADREIPVLALFGRRRELPIAGVGPNKDSAYAAATQRLIEIGHTRICLLTRSERRIPEPGAAEKAFLGELRAHGLKPSPFNLPAWEGGTKGFHQCLDSLFHLTPPTALIVDEVQFFLATLQFCANRGIRVPGDVSLVCTDDMPHFKWFMPSVAHIRWHRLPVMRRIERWAENISRGKADRRQTFTKAEFIDGGTIGPAKRGI